MVCLVDGDNPSNAHLDDTACEHSCVLAVVSHVDRRQSERALEPAKLAPEDRSQILAHGEVWPEREVSRLIRTRGLSCDLCALP